MHRFIGTVWFVAILCAALCGCKGEKGEQGLQGPIGPAGPSGSSLSQDKQIRFELVQHYYGYTHADTNWFIIPLLHKFNKMNYPGVDSILFMSVLHGQGDAVASVELHNVTEHTPIAGARFNISKTSDTDMVSGNLYDAIPPREITLGIRIRSSEKGKTAYLTGATLLLYRK